MWYRRHVTNRGDGKTRRLKRTQSRFPARTRPCNLDFEGPHAMLLSLLGRIFSRYLRRIGGRFARAFETHGPRRRPGNGIAWASVMVIMVLLKLAFTCATPEAMFLRSRRRTRVASLPIQDPFAAQLEAAATQLLCRAYFFLPAIALAGPLRVRALV